MRLSFSIVALMAVCCHAAFAQPGQSSTSNAIISLARLVNVPVDEVQIQKMLLDKSSGTDSIQDIVDKAGSAGLKLEARRLTSREIRNLGGPVILQLQKPTEFVLVSAVGPQHSLTSGKVVESKSLLSRFSGDVLTIHKTSAVQFPIKFDKAVSIVHASSTYDEIEQIVVVQNLGARVVNLAVAQTSCGCTEAKLASSSLLPKQTTNLKIRMKATGWGTKTESVTLRTDEPTQPYLMVALQAELPKNVVPNPAVMKFNVAQGQSETRRMTLLLPDRVSISRISSPISFITAKVVEKEIIEGGILAFIEISLDGKGADGPFSDRLSFELKGAKIPRISIAVEGSIEPDIIADPPSIFLGQIKNGGEAHKVFIIGSQRKQPFSIKSIHSNNPSIKSKAALDIEAAAHAVEISIKSKNLKEGLFEDHIKLILSTGEALDIKVIGMVSHVSNRESLLNSSTPLKLGQVAPDFTIKDMFGNWLDLSAYKNRKQVLLTFFSKCFTGGCTGQLSSLQAELSQFQANETDVLAVSVDSPKDQLEFAAKTGATFPLLPDMNRKISMLYGAADQSTDLSRRMSVLIDKRGIVRFIDTNVNVQSHGRDMIAKLHELGMAR